MTTIILPEGRQRYFNNDGTVAAGGKLYTYAAGTLTPKAAYTDEAGTVPHPNPIILDAKGEAVVYWSGAYKVNLLASDNTQITGYPVDNIKTDPAGVWGIIANLLGAAGAGLVGFVYATAYPVGSIGKWLKDLATSAGAGFIGFLQAGVGAVLMTIEAAMRERVSVKQFGAKGDGTTDDTAACQAAITYACTGNIKTLIWPDGIYKLTASLLVPATGSGLIMQGPSSRGGYLYTTGGAFDLLKVAASYVTIKDLFFRPGGNQLGLRVYAAHCTIDGNCFLAAINNVSTSMLLTDIDPDTAAFVAGAYTHTIKNNIVGVAGFAPAIAIDMSSTMGMQACKLLHNQILSDRCIVMPKGGANVYFANLMQSSTRGGVGIGIDLGDAAIAEKTSGNYFEQFAQGILLRNLSNASQCLYSMGNHFDACTTEVGTLGTYNYIHETAGGTLTLRSWVNNYSSNLIWRWITSTGVEGFNLTSAGIFQVGTTALTNHGLNTIGAAEGAVIFTLQGAGTSAHFFRHATGTAANAAQTGLSLRANSGTGRSLNAGGTVNAAGADYAEYLIKALLCGNLIRGQIVGINADGQLTDTWGEAVAFMVKSTNPSIVGGDNWWKHLGDRIEAPALQLPEYKGITVAPFPPMPPTSDDLDAAITYKGELADWEAATLREKADRADHAEQVAQAEAAHAAAMAEWERLDAQYDVDLEAARVRVDRIAFCGQVPVNVWGAKPGDYVIPVQNGNGIDGVAIKLPTFEQYVIAVGRVVAIEDDGRARIIVKVS